MESSRGFAVSSGDRLIDVTAELRAAGHGPGAGMSLVLRHGGCRLVDSLSLAQDVEQPDDGPAVRVTVERPGNADELRAELRQRYHAAALQHHPDHGGDTATMAATTERYRADLEAATGGHDLVLAAGQFARVPWPNDSVVVWARLDNRRPVAVAHSLLLVSVSIATPRA